MELIEIFQRKMNENGYDAYIIPTSDYHSSEYVSDYFKGREYLTGFTGSQGTLVITRDYAYLWVDGRYYIQAEKQVNDNYIKIMKIGMPQTPTIEEFLGNYLKEDMVLGFDGKVLNTNLVKSIVKNLQARIKIKADTDLLDSIWPNRPSLPFSLLYVLDTIFAGKDYSFKLGLLRNKMKSKKADIVMLTSLDEIAWLYNLRGNDVTHTPVFLAFAIVTNNDSILFINQKKLTPEVKQYLKTNSVKVKNYEEIYKYSKDILAKNIIIDLNKANYNLYSSIEQDNVIIDEPTPILLMKAVKNDVEIKNLKNIHIKDGAVIAKLMYHVKTSYENKKDISELSESDYVDKLRSEIKGFVDLSFNTIAAFNDHGAMMHYQATNESNYPINTDGFFLVDSGGHYLEGTTDITRTFGVGKISDEMKIHFTLVLKSVIALTQAVFLKGCTGQNLDILARGPIWNEMLDYKCGTGHGVGYLLSVHEAPNGFRWQKVAERNDSAVLEPGMITTNEPGIYLENRYGIRTENELLCVKKGQSEFGEFLGFETITFAPIDLDCIKVTMLTKQEKAWLNEYHESVYKKINKYLTKAEKDWLKLYTRKI